MSPGEASLIAPATMRALDVSPFSARQRPRTSIAPICFGSDCTAREAYAPADLTLPETHITYPAKALASAVLSFRPSRTCFKASFFLPADRRADT